MERATAGYSGGMPRRFTATTSPLPPPAMPCRVHASGINCASLIDRASMLHANHFLISVVACPACSLSFAAPQRPSTPWPSAAVKLPHTQYKMSLPTYTIVPWGTDPVPGRIAILPHSPLPTPTTADEFK